MDFLSPDMLWFLFALAIPIIVHLFHFKRYKKLPFTNVRLLEELLQKSSTHRRVKHLLILLSRLLALAALILAFAQPFFKGDKEIRRGQKAVSIFVDNSHSMQAQDEGVPLFEIARSKARALINTFASTDQFQILSNDLNYRERSWMSKADALSYLEQLEISNGVLTVDRLHRVISDLQSTSEASHRLSYWFSDFQLSQFEENLTLDTSVSWYVDLLDATQHQNISIDSAWFLNPTVALHQDNVLLYRLTNHSDRAEAKTKLHYVKEGRLHALGQLVIPPGASITDTASIAFSSQGGWKNLTIQLEDSPISFDDKYFMSFKLVDKVAILAIRDDDASFSFAEAFRKLPYGTFDEISHRRLNYSELQSYDLIILQELDQLSTGLIDELVKLMRLGKNVYLIPDAKGDRERYNQLLRAIKASPMGVFSQRERQVHRINRASRLYKDVYDYETKMLDLPTSKGNYPLSMNLANPAEALIWYRDGSNFLVRQSVEKGNLFVQSAPIDRSWSNFVQYVDLWLPGIYNMAVSSNADQSMAYTLGEPAVIDIGNTVKHKDEYYELVGSERFIPQQRKIPNGTRLIIDDEQIKTAGFYDIYYGEDQIRSIAFNYNRMESDMNFLNVDQLKARWPEARLIDAEDGVSLAQIIDEQNRGKPLWRYLILAALFFLLVEALLIRYLR